MRRRRAVLVIALLLTLVGGATSSALFGALKGGGFTDPGSESGRVTETLRDRFGQGPPNLVLLVTTPKGVDDPAASRAGAALAARLGAERGVVNVASYWTAGRPPQLRGSDGNKALVLATLTGDDTAVDKRVKDLAPAYQGERDGLEVRAGGYAMLQREMVEQAQKDTKLGEMIVFPVTLVALALLFGSIVAASLPLLVAFATMLLSMGVMWALSTVTDLSVLAINVVTLLGLGLAIDYSLLIVNRYREELDEGRSTSEAIGVTMRTAGRTVVFSAITVAVALSGLSLFPMLALQSMGYGGVITALLAAAVSLTVLPAMLAVLGPKIDKGRVRKRRAAAPANAEEGFWHRLASFVMRRPVPVATLATLALLVLGAPFLGIKLGWPDERVMPGSSDSRQVASVVRAEFDSSEQNALQVVVSRTSPELDGYAARLSGLPGVARVDTATGSYARGARSLPPGPQNQRFTKDGASYLSVVPSTGDSDAIEDLVTDLRDAPAPFPAEVGGTAAASLDGTEALRERLPIALGAVVAAMLVLLFLLTGSVLVPVIALALSGLSLTATFGSLVWIFQDGHLSDVLNFTVTGTTMATVPVMLFGVAFGLAMDYQVFMLGRIREEYELSGDGTRAVALGLERIGRIVTAAAVLMAIVFVAFLASGITFMKAFGIGLPLAVLMDATLIRGALLPAAMRLGGRATWWAPGPLRRFHARFGLHESEPRPVPVKTPEPIG
ncbi:MMPL family transporter [Spirillospora sp. CA-294931]|uniref:MMPL family transporter n=1 Tax=Spirillospora sp. CA-294931 TaxID=3240042 RepID=UPI003D8AC696